MFEKVTATRWRLTKESKLAMGSLLILIRNEWQTTCESIEATEEMRLSAAVTGSVVNYRKMIECLDRVLTRLEGTFDAGKLGIIAGMLEHVMALPETGPANSLLIRAAELINEPTTSDWSGHRGDSEGGNRLPGTSGAGTAE